VAYRLATGVPPFTGQTVVELCAHHLHSVPPPPSAHRALRGDLEQVILACLAKEPSARPQSAAELLRALDRCVDAHAWNDEDAEGWWQEARTTAATQAEPVALKPAARPRTIICDLHARFARGKG
jgi:serine/threonine protein kinase